MLGMKTWLGGAFAVESLARFFVDAEMGKLLVRYFPFWLKTCPTALTSQSTVFSQASNLAGGELLRTD